ncbi:PqqD family protein [Paenibacillus cremeus]|uniref:PqqD family protein n=1 Tax=Paenibacillus cremeus TaxID=2163881 RepID=A0A559K0H7_9BACL|nr:PqqD family protein [Paenibacillus cremeus]TVY05659.1 PqqD family protein [Paenibacillus cremeus]
MLQYIQKGNYDAIELEGEWIILNTSDYTVTNLNEVGGYCWSLLNEAQTVASLARAIQGKYEWVSEESVDADLEQFLSDLKQCGLIRHAD